MKSIFRLVASLVALATLTANVACAQAPFISSLKINEHSSQISIDGTFGSSTPSVTVDSTALKVLAYSDTLIRCAIPKSGQGSAGDVRIVTDKGTSNSRRISAILVPVYYDYQGYVSAPQRSGASSAHVMYPLSFRGDLSRIWSLGYRLDPVGDSITGGFGAEMSSYDTSNHTESNIHMYNVQGSISAYPVPVADQEPADVPVYAQLDYHDSSLRVSVARVDYLGTYHAQYQATPQSQPQTSSGQVSGTASAFTLHYKILPDFSLRLDAIDSDKNFYVDQAIGTPVSRSSYLDAHGAHFDHVPISATASVRSLGPSETALLYPNPAHEIVHIDQPFSKIELIDGLGRIVLTSSLEPLNVSTLADGLYFYQMQKTNSVVTGNLIIQKQ